MHDCVGEIAESAKLSGAEENIASGLAMQREEEMR